MREEGKREANIIYSRREKRPEKRREKRLEKRKEKRLEKRTEERRNRYLNVSSSH